MTKKDYELIAKALKEARPNGSNYSAMADGWRNTVAAVASALVGTNPKFDKARFLTACGV